MEPIREGIEGFIRRWRSRYEGDRVFRVPVITVVLAAYGVASASLFFQPPTYEASAQVLVGQRSSQECRLQTLEYREPPPTLGMMHAIESRPVAEETLQRLGLPTSLAAVLLEDVTVEQVVGTQFVRLTYRDVDPERAQRIVNTVGEVSSEFSERSNDIKVTVWEKAAAPESPVSPNPFRNGLLTLVIGLGLSAVLALPQPRPLAARAAGNLVGRTFSQARVPAVPRTDSSIVERVKEKKLLRALGRHGKLTAMEASLATSLSVEEANRMLFELAAQGHLEVTVEDGKLLYSFWGEHGA